VKILLAVDGSKYSDATAQAMISRLRPEGADVLVLQVIEPRIFSTPPQMAEGYAPEQEEIMKPLLAQAHEVTNWISGELQSAGFRAQPRVLVAETRGGILDAAAEWHADLIVIGSHGRRGLSRFLLGTVAESVVRSASCSVLVVRIPAKPESDTGRTQP